jgi:hypothetical protein
MRVFISNAALLVNVIAMILEKRVRSFLSESNKRIYSFTRLYVLPLPADALRTFSGFSVAEDTEKEFLK